MASAEAMIGGGIEKRGEAAGEIERHETSEDITAQRRRAEERCDMKMALSRGTESSAVDETRITQEGSSPQKGMPPDDSGIPITDRTKLELLSASSSSVRRVKFNDPINDLADKIGDLQQGAQEIYKQARRGKIFRRLEVAPLSNGTKPLLWREAYRSHLESAAQQAAGMVAVFPSDATFKQKMRLIKMVAAITQQTLNAAHFSLIESLRLKRKAAGQEIGLEKSIESIKKSREALEKAKSIEMVKENIEEEIVAALECSEKSPEEMRAFLASREKVHQLHKKKILEQLLEEESASKEAKNVPAHDERMELARIFHASQSAAWPKPMNTALSLNFDQSSMDSYSPDQNSASALSHQLFPSLRCENHEISGLEEGGENIFNQEQDSSLLQQAMIEHVIKRCQEALEAAQLLYKTATADDLLTGISHDES